MKFSKAFLLGLFATSTVNAFAPSRTFLAASFRRSHHPTVVVVVTVGGILIARWNPFLLNVSSSSFL
jgi:hypothetical protein